MANLEPIEEGDLDLKGKFLGAEPEKTEKPLGMQEIKNPESEAPAPIEKHEQSAEKEKTYSKILQKMRTSQSAATDSDEAEVEKDAAESMATETAEAKVDKLVKLAMVKGVVHAVKVAKHMDDNYTLDEFHDKLMAEEFHKALVDKGIIREL